MRKIQYYSQITTRSSNERVIAAIKSVSSEPKYWVAIDNKFIRDSKFFKSKVLRDDFDCIHWTLCNRFYSLQQIKNKNNHLFANGVDINPNIQSAFVFQEQIEGLHQFISIADNIIDLIAKEIIFFLWQKKSLLFIRPSKYADVRHKLNTKNLELIINNIRDIRACRSSNKIIGIINNPKYYEDIRQISALRNLLLHNSLMMFSNNAIIMPKLKTGLVNEYFTYMNNNDWKKWIYKISNMPLQEQRKLIKPIPNYFDEITNLLNDFIGELSEAMIIG